MQSPAISTVSRDCNVIASRLVALVSCLHRWLHCFHAACTSLLQIRCTYLSVERQQVTKLSGFSAIQTRLAFVDDLNHIEALKSENTIGNRVIFNGENCAELFGI